MVVGCALHKYQAGTEPAEMPASEGLFVPLLLASLSNTAAFEHFYLLAMLGFTCFTVIMSFALSIASCLTLLTQQREKTN